MDTAVKTAATGPTAPASSSVPVPCPRTLTRVRAASGRAGYIQRKQIKAMESHAVYYDGTVRNGADSIVQFAYAGNAFDPSRLERVKLDVLRWPTADIRRKFAADDAERILRRRTGVLHNMWMLGTEMDVRVTLPLHPTRLQRLFLEDAAGNSGRRRRGRTSRTGDEHERAVARFRTYVDSLSSSVSLQLALDYYFPRSVLLRATDAAAIDSLHARIECIVSDAKIAAGEMCGCIAAQSIGEPTTQMYAPLAPPASLPLPPSPTCPSSTGH